MKLNKKLYISFAIVFIFLMTMVVSFQYHREKEFKTENLDNRLSAYNSLIYNLYIENRQDIDELSHIVHLLPDTALRISIIDSCGLVIYDSFVKDSEYMDNHLNRPEIEASNYNGTGRVIRTSESIGTDYYYIAQKFNDIYIRTALPYDTTLSYALKINNYFIYYAAITLLLIMAVVYFLVKKFSSSIQENEDKLKRQLTQNISHELKTPLTSILGYVESIIDNPDLSAERQRYFIERTYMQAKRLRELLSDISTLNKLDDNKKIYTFEHCNLSEIIEEIIRDSSTEIEQKHFIIEKNYPAEIPLKGNPSLLHSIFRNLLDNALAYAGDNITIRIKLEAKDALYYHFSFSDNGVGVPAEHLNRLFERFYRVDKGRSRKLGGTGLGLSIVKNAVLLHHGNIQVKNIPTGGLSFSFSLRKF